MKTYAPFTAKEVIYLELWQAGIGQHPFTCCSHDGCDRFKRQDEGRLIPGEKGFVCPCGAWEQDWCHDYMCRQPRFARISGPVSYDIYKGFMETIRSLYQDDLAESLRTLRMEQSPRLQLLMTLARQLKEKIDEYENNRDTGL